MSNLIPLNDVPPCNRGCCVEAWGPMFLYFHQGPDCIAKAGQKVHCMQTCRCWPFTNWKDMQSSCHIEYVSYVAMEARINIQTDRHTYIQCIRCIQCMNAYVHACMHAYQHGIALHYITLHFITLHYIINIYIYIHSVTLHYMTIHYIAL